MVERESLTGMNFFMLDNMKQWEDWEDFEEDVYRVDERKNRTRFALIFGRGICIFC